jgi:hypothetical protein
MNRGWFLTMKAYIDQIRILPAIGILLLSARTLAAESATQTNPVIYACDKPFMFGFGSWDKAPKDFPSKPDGIHISAKNAQGGAGVAGLNVNLGGYGDWSPALTLTVCEQNQAGSLRLHLSDSDGTSHRYQFDLTRLRPGVPQQVVADYGASLAEPQSVEKTGNTPGLDNIASLMVIGDWGGNAVELVLSGITLVPPTDEMLVGRAKLKETKAQEAEKARLEAEANAKARQKLLDTGAPHLADGPEVKHICAVAPDIIAITLQAGQYVGNQLVPYVAEPGDEIVEQEKDKPIHEVKDGKVVDYFHKGLFRKVDNRRAEIGLLSPGGK